MSTAGMSERTFESQVSGIFSRQRSMRADYNQPHALSQCTSQRRRRKPQNTAATSNRKAERGSGTAVNVTAFDCTAKVPVSPAPRFVNAKSAALKPVEEPNVSNVYVAP